MMRPVITLAGTVLAVVAIAAGVNAVLGDPPLPSEPTPGPNAGPFAPDEPPLKPGEEIDWSSFPDSADYGVDLPPGEIVLGTTDTVSFGGKTVRLPVEVLLAIGMNPEAPLLPCSNERSGDGGRSP